MPQRFYEKRAYQRHLATLKGAVEIEQIITNQNGVELTGSDVSQGGIQVNYNEDRLQPGNKVVLKIAEPGKEPVKLDARVVWIRRNSINLIGKFSAGLAFRITLTTDSLNSLISHPN